VWESPRLERKQLSMVAYRLVYIMLPCSLHWHTIQIFNFLVAVSAAMSVDWIGRRTLFVVSNTGMLFSMYQVAVSDIKAWLSSAFSAWTICVALYSAMQNTAAVRGKPFVFWFKSVSERSLIYVATIPLIFIFYFFYDIAYTPLLVGYTLEILPYKVRAKGFAVMVQF